MKLFNFKKKKTVATPCLGEVIPLSLVEDGVFSEGILGDGFAVRPSEGMFYAPISARVDGIHESGHAYTLLGDDGIELLIHIGLDTVELKNGVFSPQVSVGQRVERGALLAKADIQKIKEMGYDSVTMVVVSNSEKIKISNVKFGRYESTTDIMTYEIKGH